MENVALRVLYLYNGIFVGAAAMLGPLYAIYIEKFVDGVTAVSCRDINRRNNRK